MSSAKDLMASGVDASALRLNQVTLSYGNVEVLQGIDLTLSPGEYCVVLGPSGGGKSTLLQAIAGLVVPDSGSLFLNGRSLDRVSPKDRGVSLLFQNDRLYPNWSLRRTLELANRHSPVGVSADAVKRIASEFQISELLDRRPDQVSGGQLRRAALAKAILRQPSVVLLDEPLDGLDASLRDEFVEMLRCFSRGRGADYPETAIIHVTHDGGEAMRLADRIVVLQDGMIVQTGSPEEVYRRPKTLAVATSLGVAPPNQIPLQRIRTVDVSLATRLVEQTAKKTNLATVLIRPEAIRVVDAVEGKTGMTVVGNELLVPVSFVSTRFVSGLWISRWASQGQSWTTVAIEKPVGAIQNQQAALVIALDDLVCV
ncbi:multiple sugar transport system ATP-binding protein/inositol-phosphate transport system ATP-binding protein [Neorhodopirellula lusitana]|uniref:Multiple sugar transport system ATP-binding protein/inositol-phosphate transport system ATP-binding protein n=1 Tax=Neorhodopirellula lusitana TaxID=445327 RepID=A0ABY1PNL6_9BACT|nr:ABC transporter ATP-binding protein [Neorhodopirellula lusitana]SMP39689.1 multiple sugar transport system ATP-binding protein/inositol-phosphate transport system ATP-binding protein [Neorhodopirellula lusitana]